MDSEKWLEGMNPALLFSLRDISEKELDQGRELELLKDTKVLIVEGVDRVLFDSALAVGITVLLIEEDLSKIKSLVFSDGFKPHKNLYISTKSKEQLFPILKTLVFKKAEFKGELSLVQSYLGGMEMSFSEYRDLGKDILPNILSNMLHIDKVVDGRSLDGMFSGEEVIVCGSGISLSDGIKEIKSMTKRPVIISCGSSLPRLLEEGIIPDFFAVIDANPPLEQFRCLEKISLPLFYQNRASKDLLFLHNGPKIYMGTSRGWQIEDALMNQAERESFSFDAGYHAGNFGVHIALSLGASRVFLVGMDGVSKEGEEASLKKDGLKTRGDLLYGMEFFNTLKQQFPEQQLLHYTKGLSFDKTCAVETLDVKGREKSFALTGPQEIRQDRIKSVIDRFFQHTMRESLEELFRGEEEKMQILASVAIAEMSMEPFYIHFMQPLWEVWKYLLGGAENDIQKLTFFYKLLLKFPGKCGFEKGVFFLFGKREGEYKRFDKYKVLREELYYFGGKEEGVVKRFDEKGELVYSCEMQNGLRHGKCLVYQKGRLQREGNFIQGKPHGEHRCFYKERVIEIVCYDKGEKCGVHKMYSDSGEKITEIVYKERGLYDRFSFDGSGRKVYEATWKGDFLTENFYEHSKVQSSRVGKLIDGKVVFKENV